MVPGILLLLLWRCVCAFLQEEEVSGSEIRIWAVESVLLVPFAGHVLNGFSYVSNRWIWAYGMMIAYIFVKAYPELFTLTV